MSIKELIQAELELLLEDELGELYEQIKKRNSKKDIDSDDELGDLLERCQVNTGIPDLSYQHDHHLHGTPKREVE